MYNTHLLSNSFHFSRKSLQSKKLVGVSRTSQIFLSLNLLLFLDTGKLIYFVMICAEFAVEFDVVEIGHFAPGADSV